MFVELLLSSCFVGQDPLPVETPAPAAQPPVIAPSTPLQPPGTTPAPPTPPGGVLPPADGPALAPGVPGRTPTPPRRTRGAGVPGEAPGARGAPMAAFPPGQGGFSGRVSTPAMPSQSGPIGWTQRGGELATVYGYGGFRAVDPKEAELDRSARELAGNWQREQDPAKKAQLKASLQNAVAQQFQIRQQRRTEELTRLEQEVKKLRDAMEKREKAKDAIIGRRIAELTGDDDLGF
jgi:hypothetical protein